MKLTARAGAGELDVRRQESVAMTDGATRHLVPPSRLSATASYVLLVTAWSAWLVLLTHQHWGDPQTGISRGASTGEVIQQAASMAERSLPFDVVGLAVGAAAGLALIRVGQLGRRSRWVVAAALIWLVCMAANCIGFVVHLFVMCLPGLYLLGILMDLQVAG
jgi:hypothetical protein